MVTGNPYYHRCKYLTCKYVDHGISSYCIYRCTLFGMKLSNNGVKTMCCINNSPYMGKNCRYFKDKSGSEQILLFGDN